jgi:hypothetical protein
MIARNNSYNQSTISRLPNSFNFLLNFEKHLKYKLTADKKIEIEKQKLAIMEAMLISLKPKLINKNLYKKKSTNFLKRGYFWISMLINPIIAGISSYCLCDTIFSLLPTISNPLSLICGITFGVVGGLVNVIMNTDQFKKTLGMSIFNLQPVVKIYQQQIIVAKKIKSALLSVNCIQRYNKNDYNAFNQMFLLFKKDIQHKNTQLTSCFNKSSSQKKVRWSIGGLRMLLSAGSGVFLGKSILTIFGGVALATGPIGWVVGGIFAIFSIASFFYLERKNISKTVDRMAGYPKKLFKMQNKFITRANQFENKMQFIIQNKPVIKNNIFKNSPRTDYIGSKNHLKSDFIPIGVTKTSRSIFSPKKLFLSQALFNENKMITTHLGLR